MIVEDTKNRLEVARTDRFLVAVVGLAVLAVVVRAGDGTPPPPDVGTGKVVVAKQDEPTKRTNKPGSSCKTYALKLYGIDPNDVPKTGGGTQLVTVIAATKQSSRATFTAWNKNRDGCWNPAELDTPVAQPFTAQVGRNGMVAYAKRQPSTGTTPTGLFSFDTKMYGNAGTAPNPDYAYRKLKCGDWWVEKPAHPDYDTFQHEECDSMPSYGQESEELSKVGQSYDYFIDIKMPTPPNNAAGIFLHHNSARGYTEGCVALPDGQIEAVLGWLSPNAKPHILIDAQ